LRLKGVSLVVYMRGVVNLLVGVGPKNLGSIIDLNIY
jgi:hypothetical protein